MSVVHDGDDLYWQLPNGAIYLAGGSDASNCTISVCPVELSVYGYRPSLPFSSVLIALYSLCMVVQIVLGWRYKAWGFMAAMFFGCLDEILGYGGRIMMYQNPWGQTGFIMQIGMLVLLRCLRTKSLTLTQSSSPSAQCSSQQQST